MSASPQAYRFFTPGQDMSAFEPPRTPVDHVVKLVTTTGVVGAEAGTGFLISEPGFGYIIFTARHVIRPYGYHATAIEIRTSDRQRFHAVSVAFMKGNSDATDFAVVLAYKDVTFFGALPYGKAPAGSFNATLRGYAAASETIDSVSLVNMQAGSSILRHGQISDDHAGMSGGPLVTDQRVVGCELRTDRGLKLFEAADLQPCIKAAYQAAKP